MSEAALSQTQGAVPTDSNSVWQRIRFAPPAAWVEAESYDATVPAREGMHLTHLAWARQLDAVSGASFHFTAVAARVVARRAGP